MTLDLQLFAKVLLKASYSDSAKVFTLGGNSAEHTYEYLPGSATSLNTSSVSYIGFGLDSGGTGINMVQNPDGGAFKLHVTGTSIAQNDTGSLDFDKLHITKNTDFSFDINKANLNTIDLGSYKTTVAITSAASNVSLTALGNTTLGNQAIVINSAKETKIDSTDTTLNANSYLSVKNDNYAAVLGGGTAMSGIDIAASKTSELTFNIVDGETAAKLNLANGTTGAKVTFGGQATLTSGLNNAKGVVMDLGSNTGLVTFSDITASELTLNTSVSGANIAIKESDAASSVLINADNNATVTLSGAGVETIAVNYLKDATVTTSNWKASTGDTSAKANVIDMGSLSLQSVTSSFDKNKLTLGVGATDVVINTTASDGFAGVGLKSGDTTYNALILGDGALSAKKGLKLSGFNAFIGGEENNTLDLGDVTDKKVVYLNNKVGGNSWSEWATYNGITNVKTSSVGNTLLISDMVNKETSLYGAGAGDSIFGGVGGTGNANMVDTLGSAQGKRGWFGSSNYSGHDVVIIRDDSNKETHNFDYVDAVASDAEADVLALMYGAGYIEFDSGRSGTNDSVNFCIGSDSKNYMEFRNIAGATNANNYHDFFYTYDLGKNTYKARVDLTNTDTKGTLNFSDDIEFYLGQDDTKLTIGADISNENLNFNGGGVMMGIGEIDGSNGGSGNMLNGENNFAQKISASTRYATSICGGYDNSFIDIGNDTLVGGKNTTFFVGARMGNDRIEDVDTGDKVVFLGTKYSDMTNFTSDSDRFNITFGNSAGGAAIRMETANGNTFSKVTSLTCEFDDCTLNWNGSNWVRTEK